ncbi:MAG: hypothetical protein AAF684_04130, partial [Pseudomonadota bacterium]
VVVVAEPTSWAHSAPKAICTAPLSPEAAPDRSGSTAAAAVCDRLAMGQSQTAAAAVDPERSGAASGVSGAVQMAFGALCAQLVGSATTTTPSPLAGAALLICALGLAAAVWTERALARGR